MLRGCQLADTTKWVLGLVIYTGFESKIYMNNKSPAPKVSYLGRQTNSITLQLFVMMCCVCAFAATYHVIVIQVRGEETRGRRATALYRCIWCVWYVWYVWCVMFDGLLQPPQKQ
jgi:magnesium-transporting ATPase (P-type)